MGDLLVDVRGHALDPCRPLAEEVDVALVRHVAAQVSGENAAAGLKQIVEFAAVVLLSAGEVAHLSPFPQNQSHLVNPVPCLRIRNESGVRLEFVKSRQIENRQPLRCELAQPINEFTEDFVASVEVLSSLYAPNLRALFLATFSFPTITTFVREPSGEQCAAETHGPTRCYQGDRLNEVRAIAHSIQGTTKHD